MTPFFLKWFLHKQQLHMLELLSSDKKLREVFVELVIIRGDMKTNSSLSLLKIRTEAIMCMHKGQVQNKLKRVVLHMVGSGPVGQLAKRALCIKLAYQ